MIECSLRHEQNRQTLVSSGVPGHLKIILQSHKEKENVVKLSCKAFRSFILDDDIRSEFSKAHDHARSLVEDHDMIQICLSLVKGK